MSYNGNISPSLTRSGNGNVNITTARPSRVWPYMETDLATAVASEELLCGDESEGVYTVDQAIQKLGFGCFHWTSCFAMFLSRVVCSSHLVLITILIPTIECELGISSAIGTFLNSAIFLGCLAAGIPMGILSDRYGRKVIAIFSLGFALTLELCSAFTHHFATMSLCKFLEGFCLQGVLLFPVYTTETLPTDWRSMSNLACQAGLVIGPIFTGILIFFLQPLIGWRWVTAVNTIPGFIGLLFLVFLPRSPRLAAISNDLRTAIKSLFVISRQSGGRHIPTGILRPNILVPRNKMGRVRSVFRDVFTQQFSLLLWSGRFFTQLTLTGAQLGSTVLISDPLYTKFKMPSLTSSVFQPKNETTCSEYGGWEFAVYNIGYIGELFGAVLLVPLSHFFGLKQILFVSNALYTLTSTFMLSSIIIGESVPILILTFGTRCVSRMAFNILIVYTTEIYPTYFRATALGVTESFAAGGMVVALLLSQVMVLHQLTTS